jgi:hypothetical protein
MSSRRPYLDSQGKMFSTDDLLQRVFNLEAVEAELEVSVSM